MERKEYKKFFTKTILFAIPFLCVLATELFLLPPDFFTYRSWEALKVNSKVAGLFLPGPFYPNMRLSKSEVGDLGAHTPYAKIKNVTWETDNWGYRADAGKEQYDILVVGDSTVVGTSLTQEDTLVYQLTRKTGMTAYPVGAKELSNVLYNPQFQKRIPKVVVLTYIERALSRAPLSLSEKNSSKIYFLVAGAIERWHLEGIRPYFVFVDRALKQNMYHFIQARVDSFLGPRRPLLVYGNPPMLFFQGDAANADYPPETIATLTTQVADINSYFQRRGIRFIFLPVPNKESIYWNILPQHKKPNFLPALTDALSQRGVVAIDTQSTLLRILKKDGKALYHSDDTHWNRDGVSIAADLVAAKLLSANWSVTLKK